MKRSKFPSLGKTITGGLAAVAALCIVSCNSFLDIVPDDVAELDHAFTNEMTAEKFLFTCYTYIPLSGHPSGNLAFTAGDEMWLPTPNTHTESPGWTYIAQGTRSAENPLPNFWNGSRWTFPLYTAIRDCNMFIENVEGTDKVADLTPEKRARWVAEVKFLKAYYHFYLLRLYGPIPIVDKNIPVSAMPEEVAVKRETFEDCVQYIVDLLDECNPDLPLTITDTRREKGRITKAVNRSLKARVLLMAASPLFNGNPDFAGFTDHDGVELFPAYEDGNKWAEAADAALEAIQTAELAGHELYEFLNIYPTFTMSEETRRMMSISHAVSGSWDMNNETIWGLSNTQARGSTIQNTVMPRLVESMDQNRVRANLSPPLKIARQFYTKNGVPIEEDKTLDFSDFNELWVAGTDERYVMRSGYTTARLNFDREPRFYANLGFDGGKWVFRYHPNQSDVDNYHLEGKKGQLAAGVVEWAFSVTGYYAKKLVNWNSDFGTTGVGLVEYAWPEIRLADLYLMYAEALNEAEGPVQGVYDYVNRVRERAGLETVQYSWDNFSTNPNKYRTKEGMREIIRRERLNELALEGQRYWDMLRWKTAEEYFNQPITGWDVNEADAEAYYQEKVIFDQQFVSPRDYLCPIQRTELLNNPKLVQNPGW